MECFLLINWNTVLTRVIQILLHFIGSFPWLPHSKKYSMDSQVTLRLFVKEYGFQRSLNCLIASYNNNGYVL